jgi:hypothetical protein
MRVNHSRKHLLGLAITLVLSAPALAQSNEVIINQTATAAAEGNLAEVEQTGEINLAVIEQNGNANTAIAEQNGVWLEAYQLVNGNNNKVSTRQFAVINSFVQQSAAAKKYVEIVHHPAGEKGMREMSEKIFEAVGVQIVQKKESINKDKK